ncbi:MAG: HAMP domain-containing protein [Rubrivivax sp.]|nr:HAMP domain-containing protein [Rubrivivax sp.]
MSKSTRWSLIVALVAATGVALVLAYVVSFADPEAAIDESRFVWLFWVNAAVAALLAFVVGVAVVRLWLRLRRGKFGSRLLVKLAGIFALVGVLPGLVIYTVSYQFASRSIEAWFDVRLAQALDAGLALGKSTLDTLRDDLAAKAELAAERLADAGIAGPVTPLTLERLRQQLAVEDLSLVGGNGQVLLAVGSRAGSIAPERPSATMLRTARSTGRTTQIDGLDDDPGSSQLGARVRALARLNERGIGLGAASERFVMMGQTVPPSVASNALAVQSAYREYQARALSRDGLRRVYIGTLTLGLVLSVFGAVLLAALLGNQLVRPLLLLADGVREVSAGNLAARPVFASDDELGGLTRSFAAMTQQVADAREQVQRGASQMQTILDNLTAGVVLFDRLGRVQSANPGATRILRQPLQAWQGRRLGDVPGLEDFARAVQQRFETLDTSPEPGERGQWQDSFDLKAGQPSATTLLVRGANLSGAERLLVFDDITDVVSAQRTQAWSEVARRLAHEIKNPLTPIQLSAERLQHKLDAKLEGADQAMLRRGVGTIVAQVQAMKQLVNEFRDYARLPTATMLPLDLNVLVSEVLALYGQDQEHGRLQARLGQALPQILGDASQLRQVVHNLVQNALDAIGPQGGTVSVSTDTASATDGSAQWVRLIVSDTGPGFAEHVLKRAFEPYVTTKPKGTGLGLAVVKKIADEHRARLRLSNVAAGGARVSLSFSLFQPPPEPPRATAA